MVNDDGHSYEYLEKHGTAYLYIDGRLECVGARALVQELLKDLPIHVVLELSLNMKKEDHVQQ